MYRLGLDIGGTKTVIAAMDREGTERQRILLPSLQALQSAPTPCEALAVSIRDFCQQAEIPLTAVEGIGIGFPGVMNRRSQTIISCPNLPVLDGQRLGPDLTERLGVPVFVEKDVNLLALGEYRKGRAQGISDLAFVYVGSGIGCALFLDGHLYFGADGAAGELGHTVIEPAGRRCTCGGQGCLEMYCSGKTLALQAAAILDAHEKADSVGADPTAVAWTEAVRVITAARTGHSGALQAVCTAFYYLGLGITNLVNMFNPRLVILGGGIVTGWPEGVDLVRETVQARARTVIREQLVIDRPTLGEEASLVGASALIESNLTH